MKLFFYLRKVGLAIRRRWNLLLYREKAFTCRCVQRGPVRVVRGEPVDADDRNVTDFMREKCSQWTFTGLQCDHCGRRASGTYIPEKKPQCRCYSGGPVIHVSNDHVDSDDEDITDFMRSRAAIWSFTGLRCEGCGRRGSGRYTSYTPEKSK